MMSTFPVNVVVVVSIEINSFSTTMEEGMHMKAMIVGLIGDRRTNGTMIATGIGITEGVVLCIRSMVLASETGYMVDVL